MFLGHHSPAGRSAFVLSDEFDVEVTRVLFGPRFLGGYQGPILLGRYVVVAEANFD